jgi:hypothetical protein
MLGGLDLASRCHLGYPDFMSESIGVNPNKRGRKFAGGRNTLIGVRFPAAELAALDEFISAQPQPLSRPEAIRRIIAEKLDSTQ